MTASNAYVTIKGTKAGLVFYLDDQCAYEALFADIQDKLKKYEPHVFSGHYIDVSIKLGKRYLTNEQQNELRQLIRSQGNLIVDHFESEVMLKEDALRERRNVDTKVFIGTVRSGQVIQSEGNVVVAGDVNPGGCIQANGNIFVIGSLRGMAHAGFAGQEQAVIAASIMQPTQLRIGQVVSRPPEDKEQEQFIREFAYVQGEHILIEKIKYLSEIRPKLHQLVQGLE